MLALLLAGCADARPADGLPCSSAQASCDRVHPLGVADPGSPDFHGTLVRNLGWDFTTCRGCHGDDFAGGTSGVSCLGCHASGPTSCTGCHGQPPETNAHPIHAGGGALGKKFDCVECHVKPQLYTDVGHLFAADGSIINEARVAFGALASASLATEDRPGPPAYTNGTCENVYCHGGAFQDSNAKHPAPTWRFVWHDQAACGACHGLPPSDHARSQCSECHPKVVDASGRIIDLARHLDGQLSLGDESGTCSACHAVLGGAHASHTNATHGIAKPIACASCHTVPQQVTDPGHIDHADGAIVFPAGIGGLATDDGAQPSWSAAAARCSNVYCHGGGTMLASDTSPAIVRQPTWTPGSGAGACGACHGIPPSFAPHTPALTLGDCVQCHPTTIDATGALVPNGTHLDGKVDAQ
jgi:predicted CxxxxCH...CXXCH cytochrome family protein